MPIGHRLAVTQNHRQAGLRTELSIPGVASKLALNILDSDAAGALELSDGSDVTELDLEIPDLLFFCRAFWMDAVSDGRLASWWKTLRFRMMAYTRLELPVRQIQE